jgi:hypothetical protein
MTYEKDPITRQWGGILYDFTVHQVPERSSDETIRQQLVGLTYPVRLGALRELGRIGLAITGMVGPIPHFESGIPVVLPDAITVLEQARRLELASDLAARSTDQEGFLLFPPGTGSLVSRS